MSAVAVLGVTNLLTPLSYASAADVIQNYDAKANPISTAESFSFIMPDHHVFLKASTEANKYYVHYDGNTHTSWTMWDGSWNQEFTYDETWYLAPLGFAKTWYTFSWWKNDSGTNYPDEAQVWNWTTEENGEVPIHAQWIANKYKIEYDLNKGTGTSTPVHGDSHPEDATYDHPFEVSNPTRTWYTFSGWDITNMDSEQHTVGWNASSATGASGVKGTGFNNLNATSGATVHFAAKWTANKVPYKVEHYLQDLSGSYSILSWTDNLTGTADTEVKPATGTYTWFKPDANTPYSGNIKPDGSQVFTYKYDRQSYNLTVTAGRWIMTATATGTVNTTGAYAESGQTDSTSFKYDEPVTLAFTYKPWYQSGTWSGYEDDASSFGMPAQNISKTAYATPITYTITLYPRVKDGEWIDQTQYNANSGSYTVESPDITLINPKRKNSQFGWWTGTGYPDKSPTVTIPNGSIWNRVYYATWSCDQWYHLSISGDVTSDECVPDENTPYNVRYLWEDLSGNSITLQDDHLNWVTNTRTGVVELDFVWFTPKPGNATWIIITQDWNAKVDIFYTRNQYTVNTPATTWVTYSATPEHSHEEGKAQYEDTVTINGNELSGYTFDHWEVKDASGATVPVTNSGDIEGATFKMPASSVTITPVMKKINYNLTIISHGGLSGQENRQYTVEDTVKLTNPNRPHSDFVGWSWTDLPQTTLNVTFSGRAYNSTYEEVWKCHTGYHANGADECVANEYTVNVNYKDEGNTLGDRIVPKDFTYDQTWTINKPAQSWYDFVWWKVTWISGGNATVDGQPIQEGDIVNGTGFRNLTTENGGTVILEAQWTARDDTKFTVYHYYEKVNSDEYALSWTFEYSWTTASEVTLADYVKNRSWFAYAGWYTTWGNVRPIDGAVLKTDILKDGSRAIYLYYQRRSWDVYLSGDIGVAALWWTSPEQEYTWARRYDFEDQVNVRAEPAPWYHFKEWRKKTDSTFEHDDQRGS